jgi:hypothetical protein
MVNHSDDVVAPELRLANSLTILFLDIRSGLLGFEFRLVDKVVGLMWLIWPG